MKTNTTAYNVGLRIGQQDTMALAFLRHLRILHKNAKNGVIGYSVNKIVEQAIWALYSNEPYLLNTDRCKMPHFVHVLKSVWIERSKSPAPDCSGSIQNGTFGIRINSDAKRAVEAISMLTHQSENRTILMSIYSLIEMLNDPTSDVHSCKKTSQQRHLEICRI